MAAFKHTMLVQQSTIKSSTNAVIRVGGWSESWYNPTPVPEFLNALCEKRAAILPTNAAVVGQRIQQVDPAAASQAFGRVFPGTAGVLPDIPQMALLCKARATNLINTRTIILRGIPDTYVESGEWTPSDTYLGKVQTFLDLLRSAAWKFRARNLEAAQFPILIISPVVGSATKDAIVSTSTTIPGGFDVGVTIQILGAMDANGSKRGGKFLVKESDISGGTVTITQWPYGSADGGKARLIEFILATVGETAINRIITRKVGRPFTSYRGRAAKRRRRPAA